MPGDRLMPGYRKVIEVDRHRDIVTFVDATGVSHTRDAGSPVLIAVLVRTEGDGSEQVG
jgi:hypothetical protein